MSQGIVNLADLASIERHLGVLNSNIATVSDQVQAVGQQVVNTRTELARLEQAFTAFVEADTKAKDLSLAETRLISVRHELETQFGYYVKVRQHVVGILQAIDVSIVRQETMKTATEELMLAAPRYWLAPALVALAAWLADNKPLADKALLEAIRRDDEKTSLLFALITRRTARVSACRVWLDRYFALQNPGKLDRQAVILVDALASGVFGAEVRADCSRRMTAWVEELALRAGFVEEQRKQWSDCLAIQDPCRGSCNALSVSEQIQSELGPT